MNDLLFLKRRLKTVKNINYTSLNDDNQSIETSIRWLQRMLNDFVATVFYLIQYNKYNDHEVSEIVQAIVDWYSTDECHPMKPLPKDIKDSFLGSLEVCYWRGNIR